MGFDDSDRNLLENMILNNPQTGPVIQGTGGLRKMRFASEDKGKRGGSRVLYVDYVVFETVYLVSAYPKNEKDDISSEERKLYKKLIEQTKKALEAKHK